MANHIEFDELPCLTFTSYTVDNSAETARRVAATSPYLEEYNMNFEFHHASLDSLAKMDDTIPSTSSGSDEPEFVSAYCGLVSRKSKPTGSSSKKWKLLGFLGRSKTNGRKAVKSKAKVSPVEEFYVNRTTREGEKRKTYLPYRKDIVGLFIKAN